MFTSVAQDWLPWHHASNAASKRCRKAILVYPSTQTELIDCRVGEIHVRSLTFRLDSDLDITGREFLEQLSAALLT
jgi:hypothetical protein